MESVDVGTKINITGSFISNATLTIKVNNKTVGTVVTDEGGFFSIEYNTVCGGENNLTAEFEGNEYYNPTTTKSTFYVNKKGTTISLNSIDNVNVGTKVIISGKLVDSENNPLNDFIINIHVSSEEFVTRMW